MANCCPLEHTPAAEPLAVIAVNSRYARSRIGIRMSSRSLPYRFAWRVLCLMALGCTASGSGLSGDVIVSDFAGSGLNGWEPIRFKGETGYQLVDAPGGTALLAQAQGSASGLVRKISVDLNRTPVLRWRWRVDNTLQNNNERSRIGDDYPARVYVILKSGFLSLKTRALNYVWSSHQPNGATWPNAYTTKKTDSDNTGQIAKAWYADIRFTAE